MLRDFLFFLRALWREWVVLLTGGSILAVAFLWGALSGRSLRPNAVVGIVAITFLLAAFLSWRSQWVKAGQDIIHIDFPEIDQIYAGRTSPQIRQLLRPYMGKRTTVTGKLASIIESNGPGVFPTIVTLDLSDRKVAVGFGLPCAHVLVHPWHMSFRGMEAFPQGALMTINGRISSLSGASVSLSGPELIKMEVPPPSAV
jgi:uncharacterized membrane protein YfcA